MPAGVIEQASDLLKSRLVEIDAERALLQGALLSLEGSKAKKSPGRPRGSKSKGKPGRPRGRKGGRADQAVAIITEKPGISASDMARKMKIKPNYLYRVLGELEQQGRVRKDGRVYHPA